VKENQVDIVQPKAASPTKIEEETKVNPPAKVNGSEAPVEKEVVGEQGTQVKKVVPPKGAPPPNQAQQGGQQQQRKGKKGKQPLRASPERPAAAEQVNDDEDPEEAEMRKMLGFTAFNTTKVIV
jgi:hypothetical protein